MLKKSVLIVSILLVLSLAVVSAKSTSGKLNIIDAEKLYTDKYGNIEYEFIIQYSNAKYQIENAQISLRDMESGSYYITSSFDLGSRDKITKFVRLSIPKGYSGWHYIKVELEDDDVYKRKYYELWVE